MNNILELIEKKFNKKIDLNSPIAEFCQDSISRVELLFEIEQKINKRFSEDEIFEIETVQDLINVIKKNEHI